MFLKQSGITNKDLVSDVQYYFIGLLELKKVFINLLPIEIIEKIYKYLPHKENFKNNSYEVMYNILV